MWEDLWTLKGAPLPQCLRRGVQGDGGSLGWGCCHRELRNRRCVGIITECISTPGPMSLRFQLLNAAPAGSCGPSSSEVVKLVEWWVQAKGLEHDTHCLWQHVNHEHDQLGWCLDCEERLVWESGGRCYEQLSVCVYQISWVPLHLWDGKQVVVSHLLLRFGTVNDDEETRLSCEDICPSSVPWWVKCCNWAQLEVALMQHAVESKCQEQLHDQPPNPRLLVRRQRWCSNSGRMSSHLHRTINSTKQSRHQKTIQNLLGKSHLLVQKPDPGDIVVHTFWWHKVAR